MAICPPDRPCATPTPSQAKASPSRTGNPRQTPQHRSQTHKTRGFGKAAGIKQRRFHRSCRGRAGDNPEQETLPSKTARSRSAHCSVLQAKLPGKENKPLLGREVPGVQILHLALSSAFPKTQNDQWGEQDSAMCLHRQTDTAAPGDRQQKSFGLRDAHGTERAALAQPLLC